MQPALWTLDRLKTVDVAVRVLLALGRVEEADAWAQRAPAEGGGRRTGVFGAIIAHAHAGVLLAQDRAPQAASVALDGRRQGRPGRRPAVGRPLPHPRRGGAGRAHGSVEDARGELRQAAAASSRPMARGATATPRCACCVASATGRARRAPRARARHDGDGRLGALTPREREVAALVADGQTNAQIAARLHLSESTVEKHVSRVLAKLGLSTRAGVVRLLAHERASLA